MNEMKPCPFCGSKALTNIFLDYEDIENLPTNVIDDYEPEVTCENERCINGWYLSPKQWNARPIEDALRKRIAELESAQRWIPVSERLPEDLQSVLTISKDNNEPVTAWFEDDFWWSSVDWSLSVTHWMPLPESPNDTQTDTVVYGKDSD